MVQIKIEAPFYTTKPNIIVITKENYLYKYDVLEQSNYNSILIINTNKEDNILNKLLPNNIKQTIKEKNIKVYKIDANDISSKSGSFILMPHSLLLVLQYRFTTTISFDRFFSLEIGSLVHPLPLWLWRLSPPTGLQDFF